jgi:XTP/dITP diphosphohydrolase
MTHHNPQTLKKIVFATNNAHKLSELRQILGARYDIVSLDDIGCHDDIPETADTLEGNALQKAQWVKECYGYDCFADDTGLMVDALGGAPGVMSARYAGDAHDSAANVALLLKNLADVAPEQRTARFRTVICLMLNGETHYFEGVVEGHIIAEMHGAGGFGYDPVFVPQGWSKTFAEATPDEKNAISHRGRAVAKLSRFLETI